MLGDKRLFFDVETTGVDERENGIWSMSGIIEVGGQEKHKFDFEVAPFPDDKMHPKALEMSGRTEEQLRALTPPGKVHQVLTTLFAKYVNKYDPNDKFVMVGYNTDFDDRMLRAWFKKQGDNYYGSWISGYRVCLYHRVIWLAHRGFLKCENLKLHTVCQQFGIEFDPHKSLEDIIATRRLYYKILEDLEARGDGASSP